MRFLIPHTRELCYYSGSFFLEKIAEKLEERGQEVLFLELSDDFCDYDQLEKTLDSSFDCILDINSKMPYMMIDDNTRLIDVLDTPFYNYIVDHPLYHHPGLYFNLNNYHAIGIDQYHCEFMKKHYPHLAGVDYLPLGATRSIEITDYSERTTDLLIPTTYEEEHDILFTLRDMGDNFYSLGMDLVDLLEYGTPIENGLEKLLTDKKQCCQDYNCRDFAELLNHLYPVDKYVRFSRRRKVVEAVGKAGIPATIIGDGWITTDLSEYKNLTFLPGRAITVSFSMMANSKIVLDINPLFAKGVHDRVTTAMANEALCFSDMNLNADSLLEDGKNIISYSSHDLTDLTDKLIHYIKKPAPEISRAGYNFYESNYSWDCWTDKFIKLVLPQE